MTPPCAIYFMSPYRITLSFVAMLTFVVTSVGCATIKTPTWPWSSSTAAKQTEANIAGELGEDADSEVISSEFKEQNSATGWDAFKGDNIKRHWKKMTGRGPNEPVARKALAEGDALFRDKKYADAINVYKKAIERWPDSSIEEDGTWQLAECYFFTDQYPKAEDCYDELVKKFGNTRYLDRIAKRQFSIGSYWVSLDQASHLPVIMPNVINRSRPLFDTRGRALKAFDHVRINDPRGSLADDSVMAQANAHFLDKNWIDSDYFYGLLRTEYPDSKFQLEAHMLGLQSKIHAYQGAGYEGAILNEAEMLSEQLLVQFPDRLNKDDEARVLRARAEIVAQQALRNFDRAEFYEKGKQYSSARIYYGLVVRDQPKAILATQSLAKLESIKGLSDVSDDPLPLLTRVLNPDALKEAELDAMAESEPALVSDSNSQGSDTTAQSPREPLR